MLRIVLNVRSWIAKIGRRAVLIKVSQVISEKASDQYSFLFLRYCSATPTSWLGHPNHPETKLSFVLVLVLLPFFARHLATLLGRYWRLL
jgi:hypothetical protein